MTEIRVPTLGDGQRGDDRRGSRSRATASRRQPLIELETDK